MVTDPILDCVGGCALAAAASVALGLLLRGCGLRRAWLLSGLLVGVLLGPLALARVREGWYDCLYHGAAPERRELFVAERAIEVAEMTALPRGAGVDPESLARFEAERESARRGLQQARERFDEPATWIVAALASMACVACSPLIGRSAWWRDGGAPLGAWAIAAPATLVVVALAFSAQPEPSAWWLDVVAVVCVAGASMAPRDRWIAARMVGALVPSIDAARTAAGMTALALVTCARVVEGVPALPWLLPWGALLAAWGLACAPHGWPGRLARPAAGAAVAIAMTRLDPINEWRPWPVLAMFVAAEDLKWIGAATGLCLWGHVRWVRSLRACMPLADSSLSMGALAAAGLLSGVLPVWAGLGAMASAAAVELLEPVRRGTALQLDAAVSAERGDAA